MIILSMDLKYKFQRRQSDHSRRFSAMEPRSNQLQNQQRRFTQPQRPSALMRRLSQNNNARSIQFKKLELDTQNVFYEHKSQQITREDLTYWRKVLLAVWFALALSYIFIGQLYLYRGICPPDATCGVFIHCPNYFQHDKINNVCKVDSSIVKEVGSVAKAQIQRLQFYYGDLLVEGILFDVPNLQIDSLYKQIDNQSKRKIYEEQFFKFFRSAQNQQDLNFTIRNNQIFPTVRKYGIISEWKLLSKNYINTFTLSVFLIVMFIILTYACKCLYCMYQCCLCMIFYKDCLKGLSQMIWKCTFWIFNLIRWPITCLQRKNSNAEKDIFEKQKEIVQEKVQDMDNRSARISKETNSTKVNSSI